MFSKTNIAILLYFLVILFLSVHLNFIGNLLFFPWSFFLGWLFFSPRKTSSSVKSFLGHWGWVLIPLSTLIFIRIFLYVKYSGFPPLGYDMGIYKYEFAHAKNFSDALKTSFYPGLILLVSLLQKIGFSIDFLMRDFYILLNVIVGGMVYITACDFFGKKAGFLALIFYVASVAQFNAYYFFLYKNILALPFLLGSLILLRRRSYWVIPVAIATGVIQAPDFLILGLSMIGAFFYSFKDKVERRYLFSTGLLILSLFLFAFVFRFDQILEGIHIVLTRGQADKVLRLGGSFMTLAMYVGLHFHSIPFMVLGVLAPLVSKEKFPVRNYYLYSALLVTLLIVLFKVIFYNRYLIEMDLFASIFAGLGASLLVNSFAHKVWQKVCWMILIVFSLLGIVWRTSITIPLIPPQEIIQIERLCDLPSDALVMSTHAYYSAWLRGYSCHEVIAPLSFELNRWDEQGWKDFRSGDPVKIQNQMKQLAIYKKPIYIFIGQVEGYMDFYNIPGFTRISPYLWLWDPSPPDQWQSDRRS